MMRGLFLTLCLTAMLWAHGCSAGKKVSRVHSRSSSSYYQPQTRLDHRPYVPRRSSYYSASSHTKPHTPWKSRTPKVSRPTPWNPRPSQPTPWRSRLFKPSSPYYNPAPVTISHVPKLPPQNTPKAYPPLRDAPRHSKPRLTFVDLRSRFRTRPDNPTLQPNPKPVAPIIPVGPKPVSTTLSPVATAPPPSTSLDYCRAASAGQNVPATTVFPPEPFVFYSEQFLKRIPYLGQVDVDKKFAVIITDEDAEVDDIGAEETRTKFDFDGDIPLLIIKAIDEETEVCFFTEFYCNNYDFWASLVNSYIYSGIVSLPIDDDALEYKVDGVFDILDTIFQQRPNVVDFCSRAQIIYHMTPGFETIDNLGATVTAINHAGYVNIYVGQAYEF